MDKTTDEQKAYPSYGMWDKGMPEFGGGRVAAVICTIIKYASGGVIVAVVAIAGLAWIGREVVQREGSLDRPALIIIALMILTIGLLAMRWLVNVKNSQQNEDQTTQSRYCSGSPQEDGGTSG